MKNLAIIPARSGSKGLPDKNIRKLMGKPLLCYSVEAALASGVFDTVMVSTDSETYGEIARDCGAEVPWLRSAQYATDNASSASLILEVLSRYEAEGKCFDTFALLQPTSPLRKASDIVKAYHMYEEKRATAVVSVCEAEHSPLLCNILPEDGSLSGFLTPAVSGSRRQDLGTYYRLNGAIYIADTKVYQETSDFYGAKSYAYVMDRRASVDIDDIYDFLYAEAILETEGEMP